MFRQFRCPRGALAPYTCWPATSDAPADTPAARGPGLATAVAIVLLVAWLLAPAARAEDNVTLRSAVDSRLVRAGVGDYSLLAAVSTEVGGWERFTLVPVGENTVALRSVQNGKYVRAGVGSDSLLAAVSDAIGGWETFELIRLPSGEITLRSAQSGLYVRAGMGEHSFLAAASSQVGAWERFVLDRAATGIPYGMLPGLITPPVTPDAPRLAPGLLAIPPSQLPAPAESAGEADRWIADNLPHLGRVMGELGNVVASAQRQRYHAAPATLDSMMRPPMDSRDRIMESLILGQQPLLVLPEPDRLRGAPDLSRVYLPPQVESLSYIPVAEALEPDMYVLIRGTGFGPAPGRVYLSYYVGTGELYEGRTQHHVELLPLSDDWSRAWSDHQVAVRVPSTLPGGADMGGEREATLLLVRSNGAQVPMQVTFRGGTQPVVTAVNSDRATIGCCCPVGTEVWSRLPGSHDFVYWPRPVAQYAWQSPCGLEQWDWVGPGSRIVVHGKRFGNPPAGQRQPQGAGLELQIPGDTGGVPGTLRVIVETWTDTRIVAHIESVAIRGYYQVRPAWLDLRTPTGRANLRPLAFDPEMASKWVSGYNWIERRVRDQDEAQESPARDAMFVKHVPNCQMMWGDKAMRNEKGPDYFFTDTPYPDDVRITWVRFQHINPGDPSDAWRVFGSSIWELAGAIVDPSSLITFGIKTFITGLLLQGEGGYHAYPPHPPQSDRSERFYVQWETSCAVGGGKPIIYLIAFLIEGPPEALARY